MIWFLRVLFLGILGAMLWATVSASLHTALWLLPVEIWRHPWFVATLFDAYFGFITFFVWVCYKESSWVGRIIWFVAIMLFGNIAMAIYMLLILFRLPPDANLDAVFRKKV